jgi:hypothetical protein
LFLLFATYSMSDTMNERLSQHIVQRGDDSQSTAGPDGSIGKKLGVLDRQRYLTARSAPLMPRLRWSDGISSVSDLEAKYIVELALC